MWSDPSKIEIEELFDEECTLGTIIRKIDGEEGTDDSAKKKEGNTAVVSTEGKNTENKHAANTKKKGPSTFQVIFCFCCRGNKNGTKK